MQPTVPDPAEHTEALRRIARSLLRSAADADDLIQDAWLASTHRAPDAVKNPQAWMTGTVQNLVRSEVRDRARRRAREERSARTEAILEDPSSPISREETRRAVRLAVEKLDEPQRTVVKLHYFEGLSTREVARQTEASQASVQRYLRLASDSLQTRLRAEYEGSDRLLGVALIGAFTWERRELQAAALATEAAASGAFLSLLNRWLVAGLVLLVGVGALVLRSSADDEEVAPEADRVAVLTPPDVRSTSQDGVEPIDTASNARVPGEGIEAAGLVPQVPADAEEPPSEQGDLPTSPTEQRFLVLDPTGVPVMGAEIVAPGPNGDVLRATTDADGRAAVDFGDSPSFSSQRGGPQDSVMAFARFTGFAETNAKLLKKSGDEREVITLTFESPELIIEGQVLRPDGTPAAGAAVERNALDSASSRLGIAVRKDAEGYLEHPRSQKTTADENGRFRLTGVPRGLQMVEVRCEGCMPASHPVAESDLETVECTVQLEKGGIIAGSVIAPDGSPASRAEVYILPQSMSRASPTFFYADDDGAFRFTSALPGRTKIYARLGTAQVTLEIQVVQGEETPLTIRLAEPPKFEVVVVDEDGAPLTGYLLEVQSVGQRWLQRKSPLSERGAAAVSDFPQEPLWLMVHDPKVSIPLLVHRVNAPEVGATYTLTCPRQHASLGVASGLLRIGGEVPEPGFRISADMPSVSVGRAVPVDPVTGAFEIDHLPAGEYLIIAQSPTRGKVQAGKITFGGKDADLGVLDLPPMGTLAIDWRWPASEAASYRVRQIYIKEGSGGEAYITVAEGSGAPPPSLNLLPGAYGVVVKDETGASIQQRGVVVRPEFTQAAIMGPEERFAGAADFVVVGDQPAQLAVETHALDAPDDEAFDAMSIDVLKSSISEATLRESQALKPGWNGTYSGSFDFDAASRWVIVVETADGLRHVAPLARIATGSIIAPTFEVSTKGMKEIAHWGH